MLKNRLQMERRMNLRLESCSDRTVNEENPKKLHEDGVVSGLRELE